MWSNLVVCFRLFNLNISTDEKLNMIGSLRFGEDENTFFGFHWLQRSSRGRKCPSKFPRLSIWSVCWFCLASLNSTLKKIYRRIEKILKPDSWSMAGRSGSYDKFLKQTPDFILCQKFQSFCLLCRRDRLKELLRFRFHISFELLREEITLLIFDQCSFKFNITGYIHVVFFLASTYDSLRN